MKKILAPMLSLCLAMPTLASTPAAIHHIAIMNNDVNESFALTSQTTKTVYRTETVEGTCTREVIVGYERVCDGLVGNYNNFLKNLVVNNDPPPRRPGDNHGQNPQPTPPGPGPRPEPRPEPRPIPRPEPRPEPRPIPRPEPRPEPRPIPRPEPRPEPRPIPRPEPRPEPRPYPRPPVCYDRPIYRTDTYSCPRTVSVPYEVFDHSTLANLNVSISKAPLSKPQTENCGMNFGLQEDSLYVNNDCSEYLAIVSSTTNEHRENSVLIKDINYQVNLYDAESVFSPLKGNLQNMHMEGNELVVQTGNLTNANNFSLKLFVERRRFLKEDVVVINRDLLRGEFMYQPINSDIGNVRIDLSKLINGFQSDRKNVIKLDLEIHLEPGTILNNSQMPNLHQESTITING